MRENAAVSGPGRTEIRTADQARWQGVSWLAPEGLGEHPALSGRPPIWPLEGAHYSGRRPACSGAGLRVAVEVNKAGVRK